VPPTNLATLKGSHYEKQFISTEKKVGLRELPRHGFVGQSSKAGPAVHPRSQSVNKIGGDKVEGRGSPHDLANQFESSSLSKFLSS
jgi:hypothetical protein